MPSLTHVMTMSPQIDPEASHLTDLALSDGGTLYATTRGDGDVQAWQVSANGLTLLHSTPYDGAAIAGGNPQILVLGEHIFSGGYTFRVAPDGKFTAPTIIPNMPVAQLLGDVAVVGTTIIAAIGGQTGLAALDVDETGAFLGYSIIGTDVSITALTSVQFASASYVITASQSAAAIDVWTAAADGSLLPLHQIDSDDGLWIAAPTALETVQYEGQTYVVLAAAGSSSLTVMTMGEGGELIITDHLIDDRNSRFDSITELATVTHNNSVYLIAAGTDDGTSIFKFLPGGTLLALDHFADTPEMSLANASSITAQSRDLGLDLFYSSATESGITQLRLELGDQNEAQYSTIYGGLNRGNEGNDMLIGGAGYDRLIGGAGDDIIIDGGAIDLISGGIGADIFVMAADGSEDTITDFVSGVDRLDLTAWIGLRSLGQLDIRDVNDGIRIIYGDETLFLLQQADAALSANLLFENSITFSTRIDSAITIGHTSVATVTPELPTYVAAEPDPDPVKIPVTGLTYVGGDFADRIVGADRDDILSGSGGSDVIYGLSGDDTLHGGAGQDRVYGNNGNDTLTGGSGRNENWTRDTDFSADELFGGGGNDVISGGSGADTLGGNSGNDILSGGSGRDTFVFERGHDIITDYSTYVDSLLFEGKLTSRNTNTAEVVAQYARIEDNSLVFDFGSKGTLTLEGITSTDGIADAISFY